MKQIYIYDKLNKKEVIKLEIDFKWISPEIIAMYAVLTRFLYINESREPWSLLLSFLNMRDNWSIFSKEYEEWWLKAFLHDYAVEVIDWDEKLEWAVTVEDLFS